MNQVMNALQDLWASVVGFLPALISALLLFLLAWLLATLVKKAVSKGLQAVHFDQKLASWGVVSTLEDGKQMIQSLAKVFYYLIWLFFIPGILQRLGLGNIAAPLTNMFDGFLNFIPKLFGAVIILGIGYFVAKFVKELVQNILETLPIDRYIKKYTSKTAGTASPEKVKKQKGTIANVLANTVFVVILIPIVTMALETLQIKSISEPITNVLDQVLAAIPHIIVAIILLFVGGVIAKMVGDLLEGLLETSGIDQYSKYLNTKGSQSIRLSQVIANVVQTVIVIFFLVEALNTLNLQVLNTIGVAIINYLPSVLFALIILGLGIVGGNMLSAFLKDATGSALVGMSVKYLIYVLAIFMTLSQLQFASTIVTAAFLFIVGGLAVAFALAFGLGGKTFAQNQLKKLDDTLEAESKKPTDHAQKTETEKKLNPKN